MAGRLPPQDAEDASGAVFRIVAGDSVTSEDLKTYDELGLAPSAPACNRRALSVYRTRETACHRLKLSPRLRTAVASATLNPADGKLKLTNPRSGHISWWPFDGVDRLAPFTEASPCP
jgi:hypothetical protein